MVAGEVKQKELSDFVSVITKDNPVSSRKPSCEDVY